MPTHDAVNEWIRTSGAFDAVVDFDAATRDPDKPKALKAEYDSGDHLHPSDAGYDAMAAAVDLAQLRGPDCAEPSAALPAPSAPPAPAAAPAPPPAGPPNPAAQVGARLSVRFVGRRVSGRLRLPAGLPRTACRGGSVILAVGRSRRRVPLRADCSFTARVRRGRRVVVRFSGTSTLLPQTVTRKARRRARASRSS
jgi:hypothetical protein